MKKRLISLFAIIFPVLAISILAVVNFNHLSIAKGDLEHNEHCHWNHYLRVEPTYSTRGIQEYYVCCEHHDSSLDAPLEGIISDKGFPSQEFIGSLANDDFRLIPSYQEQLEPIQSEIDKIPAHIGATDGSLIDKAYNDYNALTESMKGYVQNVQKLTDAYTNYHQNFGILIDTVQNEYVYKIFNSTYDLELGYDNSYGYYSSFDNIVMHDDCWFSLGKNADTLIYDYNEVYFYAYNDSNVERDIQIREQYNFVMSSKVALAPHTWTKVVIPDKVFVTYKLNDLFLGVYINGMLDQTVTDGFKFTSLYGVLGKTINANYINSANEEDFNNNVTMEGDDIKLTENDFAVHVIPDRYGSSLGDINLRTQNTYSNVTNISMDLKIVGTGTGWLGFGHSDNIAQSNIYTNITTISPSTTNNEFRHFSINVNITGPDYIFFVVEVNTFHPELYIDNVVITCGSTTYTDDFNSGESTLFINDPAVLKTAVSFEAITEESYALEYGSPDYCLAVNTGNYGGSEVDYLPSFTSKNSYTGITNISFDVKIDGTMISPEGSEQLWWGFTVTANQNDDVYTNVGAFVREVLTTDNGWTHLSYSGSGDGYVRFVINPAKTTNMLYLDNITIEHSTGVVAEGFNHDGPVNFNAGTFTSIEERANLSVTFNGGTGQNEYAIIVDAWNYGNRSGNQATLSSKNKYANVTQVSFDLMIEGTISDSNPSDYWVGIGHFATAGASIYKGINLRNLTTTNDAWIHLDFTFNNITDAEYINFCSNPGHGHNNLYVDNFVIVSGGVTYTDGIDNGESSLFNLGSDTAIFAIPEEVENMDLETAIVDCPVYFEGPAFIKDGLPGNESLVFGDITHEITGNGQYVILIYNDASNVEFLLVNQNSIKLYRNNNLVAAQNIVSTTYNLIITNSGAVSINHNYLGQATSTNDALRFVSLFATGKVIFSKINLSTTIYTINSTETIDGIEVPNFEGEENITFAAYGSPTVASWDGGTNPSMMTDEAWQDYINAGFRKCIPLYEGRTGARYNFNTVYDQYLEETDPTQKGVLKAQLGNLIDQMCQKANQDAMEALALAEKYGVKYVVLNTIIFELIHHTTPNGNFIQPEDYEFIFDRVFRNDYEYFEQVNYYGNFLQDEPLTDADNAPLKRLLAALTLYYKYCNNLGIISEPVVNLLPGGDTSAYISYLDYYFQYIAPMIGYVSFDQYVLDQSGSSYSIRTEHLLNLEMMAQRILASGHRIQLRTYIFPHAVAEGSHRAITLANELRFQIYANLCFGASEIIYYGYTCHTNDDRETTIGLVNMYTLEKSQVYYFAKEVNNEVLTFGAAYRRFDWQGVMYKERNSTFYRCTQMRQLQHALSSHAGISSYTVTRHGLIGCFENPNGDYAYMVMHYGDPKTESNNNSIKITFADRYNTIIVYQGGQKHAYRLTNHAYTFTLAAGCGAFVIPLALN